MESPSYSYEFSASQDELIRDLAKKMQFVAYITLAIAVLVFVAGVIALTQGGFGGIIQGVIAFLIGWWTLNASKAFQRIADTSGNDMENLMGALGELRKLYTLQFWLLIIGLIFIVIGLIFAVITTFSVGG